MDRTHRLCKNIISKSSGILFKLRDYIDICGNAAIIHLDQINKLQKSYIRIITFSQYFDSTSSLFRKLEILNLKTLLFIEYP